MVISLLLMPSPSLLTEASWCGGKRGPFSHDFALEQPSSLLRTTFLGFPSFSDTKLWMNHLSFPKSSSLGFKRRSIIVRASPETEGNEASDSVLPPFEGEAAAAPSSIENLPLESKQQMLLEQKLRMKLAKKIRLRRKRLVRKRRMRKKGRWPPSKMKKNKNV
ncbi:hypothetical protein HPP92_010992 [Vanilla planifolia]|uniref:50S ribosomal protein 5, chloroplastic n=1 Tax=Vanilla planifolia TaxID=51239 RepID=A0A835R1J8_VANPL|nr:hypothetical protein HPP92_011277 [Vanilla planifolia]KAG0482908.1 hypothetical protein HPP92_010992 [Vanilla planifolia]